MIDVINEPGSRGFAVVPKVIDESTRQDLLDAVNLLKGVGRNRPLAGIRTVLQSPVIRKVAEGVKLSSLVGPVLGEQFSAVRGIYFDKHRLANWKVAWHQDLTIAVKERKEVEGYSAWSLKAGIHHVQPPERILKRMVAVRIHLDDTDETNGELRVVPGSHCLGRLSEEAIRDLTARNSQVHCPVERGGVMLMRPLLLHASSAATAPRHRRVLHIEYAAGKLDNGLEWFEE
jgi:hypothetical protein